MVLSEEVRRRLSRWCADRVPGPERPHRQVGYTVHGSEVTITERRAPLYPELGTAWTSQPLVRLRLEDPSAGRWIAYRPEGADGEWMPSGAETGDPIALLNDVLGAGGVVR
ncbi:MAG: hypothetical protein L0H84_13830 [Pseudonocardia sp.]|nr:hypothetical protein [Pseudonocardia sp.]